VNDCFYFGPIGRAGHFLWAPCNGNPSWTDSPGRRGWRQFIPWREEELDGRPQPKRPPDHSWQLKTEEREPQGKYLFHERKGWGLIAFWDRSCDERSACCSVFLVKGATNAEEVIARAKLEFPMVFARFTFPLVPSENLEPEKPFSDG
jgi:hypothetical protein